MYYVEYIITSIYKQSKQYDNGNFFGMYFTVSFMIFESFANFQNSKETCVCVVSERNLTYMRPILLFCSRNNAANELLAIIFLC